ncbi:MAG TPA: hypothetical protein ENI31_01090 [Candidatus Omnitrophica bacterium]|nr:MAG: hypothetical protein DRP61_02420 [Candidatus Omnitrophota bacterium]RKY35705.1 MAG: hypothetical protein DRP69_00380 [Candidatus Omnitrophota bacterium]HEC68871.1 hypothetical protein [Candidatus Omnitrophota bacterium]
MKVCLEIGPRELRCARLEKRANTLLIFQLDTLTIPEDIFKNKDTKAFAFLIKEFFRKKGISLKNLYLSFWDKDAIFQELVLPPVPSSEINQIVINEIEKLPYFSQGNYLYTYNVYSTEDKKKVRVLYLAFSRDFFDFSLQALRECRANVLGFDIVPLNILNLFYSQPQSEPRGLILVENSLSYVLVFEKEELSIIYVANSGLEDICQKEGGINQASFKVWAEEVKRAFKFYETATRKIVKDIFLIWDNQKVKDLDKVFSSYSGREVSELRLPCKIKFFKEAEREKFNYKYLSLIATSLRTFGIKHEFDLERIWSREKTPEFLRKVLISSITYIVFIGVLVGMLSFYFINSEKNLKRKIKKLSQKVNFLRRRTQALKMEKEKYLTLRDEILKQANFISKLNRVSWSKVFLEIGKALPKEVWLKSFRAEKASLIKLEGYSLSLDSVASLIRSLKNIELLRNVKFNFVRERKIEDKDIKEFGIEASLSLKSEITLNNK